jgi:YVTN family beta-propeller protein
VSRHIAALILFLSLALTFGCNTPQPSATPEQANTAGYRVYVSNESSGDLSVIDPTTNKVVATLELGKRPRGIHASPDRKEIYVALSGSPLAPPGVDESKLPPPDRSADGIGVIDVGQLKKTRILHSGIDPENFDVGPDGRTIFVSNEDGAAVSFVDVASGNVVHSVKVGEEPEGVKVSPDGRVV